MGKSSIVFDVKMCLKEIDFIGMSKREFRAARIIGIHSLKQKEHSLSASQNFVKWTRDQYGVMRIYELTVEHYKAYLKYLEKAGRSMGHRRNIETALRHLQAGLNARSLRFEKTNVTFVPTGRLTPSTVAMVQNRSYSEEEFLLLLDFIPHTTKDAVLLMYELGLRVKESAKIRVEHFIKINENWQIYIEKGNGVTKGGRFRQLDVPKHFEPELERMLNGKSPNDQLVNIKVDTIRKSVSKGLKKAGIEQRKRGCHGFRHAYARKRLQTLMEERNIKKGHEMLQRILDNKENGKVADYGIFSPNDKSLFIAVRGVIDQIHSEIGHGKDRWDLAMVYMKD